MNKKLQMIWALRLFQQLHQDDNPIWYRTSGNMTCRLCGLLYRQHPLDESHPGFNYAFDRRLCDGTIVHL